MLNRHRFAPYARELRPRGTTAATRTGATDLGTTGAIRRLDLKPKAESSTSPGMLSGSTSSS